MKRTLVHEDSENRGQLDLIAQEALSNAIFLKERVSYNKKKKKSNREEKT